MARATFRYTRQPHLTQHVSSLVLLAVCLGLAALPGAEATWASVVHAIPEWVLIVIVPWVLHLALFWVVSLAFHVVDTTDRPAFVARTRIQTGKRIQPPLPKVLKNLAVNQLLLSPVMLVVIWGLLRLRGWSPQPSFPALWVFLLELAGMGVLSVIWFYASHRFLHRKWWMRKVHRVHHEFRTTSAMASEYQHWFEFVFGSFGTLGVGVVVIAPSLPAIYVFTLLSILTVLAHHSGYALPIVSWPVHHDWHHYRVRECFGTVGVLDRILGTDEEFHELSDGEER